MKTGLEKIKETVAKLGKDENGWRVATTGFGDRQSYAGDFTLRAAAAMAGIYGNDAIEALYPLLATERVPSGENARVSANQNDVGKILEVRIGSDQGGAEPARGRVDDRVRHREPPFERDVRRLEGECFVHWHNRRSAE
jgi:hypothetical protein